MRLLLCCDLDGTLLPNGDESESPGVRALLGRFVEESGSELAFVSGRNRRLIESAMEQYELPVPHYVVGDIGTTLYEIDSGSWVEVPEWRDDIALGWEGRRAKDLEHLLEGFEELRPQEAIFQHDCKLSFYTDRDVHSVDLCRRVEERLIAHGVKASVIHSVDPSLSLGLLDVLPERGTKWHAVEFLADRIGYEVDEIVFAGDSGNDLEVLESSIPAVLVANAAADVRQRAVKGAESKGHEGCLLLAKGGFLGTNGNYAAGILEGLAHFRPECVDTLERLWRELGMEVG
ncbi:MAG: haloacid dehalogenase [Planctomycetota bacterium]|nr:MAG: haloacid dehalogenase [Planctomycetota bacterium]